jgi:hypothetical protein
MACAGKRSSADEALVKAIREANPTVATKIHILDARPKANAVANKLKGFGYESKSAYENMEFTFLDIQNIHTMRSSLAQLMECCYPAVDESSWSGAVDASHWLRHVRLVILGAVRVVELMCAGNSCIVHCSDGWDRSLNTQTPTCSLPCVFAFCHLHRPPRAPAPSPRLLHLLVSSLALPCSLLTPLFSILPFISFGSHAIDNYRLGWHRVEQGVTMHS